MNIGGEIDDCKNLTKPRTLIRVYTRGIKKICVYFCTNYILAYVIYHII